MTILLYSTNEFPIDDIMYGTQRRFLVLDSMRNQPGHCIKSTYKGPHFPVLLV